MVLMTNYSQTALKLSISAAGKIAYPNSLLAYNASFMSASTKASFVRLQAIALRSVL
jgi:hypothetical protein